MNSDYENSLACSMCYAKHLGKAVVEFAEYLDDGSRWAELSRAVGDIGCAEDHAAALGKASERSRLRDIRSRLWSGDRAAHGELQSMAADAARDAARAREAEESARRERVREAVAARKAAEASAQGGQAV